MVMKVIIVNFDNLFNSFFNRVNDWAPILNTIRINKSLEFIAIRSYYTPPSDDNGNKFFSTPAFITNCIRRNNCCVIFIAISVMSKIVRPKDLTDKISFRLTKN